MSTCTCCRLFLAAHLLYADNSTFVLVLMRSSCGPGRFNSQDYSVSVSANINDLLKKKGTFKRCHNVQ